MQTTINHHELNHLISYILTEYRTFGNTRKGKKTVFDLIENPDDLILVSHQTIMPFKKAIFPNHAAVIEEIPPTALIGLHSCDLHALNTLYKQFSDTDVLPSRRSLLIVGASCFHSPECFCEVTETNKPDHFDLFIEHKKGHEYAIFTGSKKGETIFKKMKFKNINLTLEPISYNKEEPWDFDKIRDIVDNRTKFSDFWNNISDNCFGCGACSVVCPLCFCTRQDFNNEVDGDCKLCLNWDACFAKKFSEIQHEVDLRPENADRLYNWYHHKFVRAQKDGGKPLCTGCGRCIAACPANLNMKNIINVLSKKNEE